MLDRATTTHQTRPENRNRVAHLAPAALALVMSVAFSWRPSLWRDETASVSAATRPVPALARMLGNVDAVHGLYYLLLHPVASVSLAEWWLRLPSALAVAGTAVLLVVLGRQLADLRTGVVAATLWALLPISSRYGQEARSTALGVLIAVAATVVLVEALRHRTSRWWVGYGALLIVGGYMFLFSLLIIAGHAFIVTATRRVARRTLVSFAVALIGVALAISPLALLSQAQFAGQLGWVMSSPSVSDLPQLSWSLWFSDQQLGVLMWVLVASGVIAALVRGGRTQSERSRALIATSLATAGMPPAILLIASSFRPVFLDRYVAEGAAFLTLMAAYGVTRVRGRAGLAIVSATFVALGSVAFPQLRADRTEYGHGDDIRAAASVVAASRQPGDAIVWSPSLARTFATAFPSGFAGLDDIALEVSPVDDGTLSGKDAPETVLIGKLSTVTRVWVIRLGHGGSFSGSGQLAEAGFQPVRSWQEKGTTLQLMTRS